MPDCEKCGLLCRSIKALTKHQKSGKYCQKYKDVDFVCRKCNFITDSIKTIEEHITVCKLEPIINTFEEQKNKDMLISNLQLRIKFENMKNSIYTNIIKTHTSINIDNIIQEHTNEIHIFNFNNGNIPLVVHDFNNKKENYILKPTKIKKTTICEKDIDDITKPTKIKKTTICEKDINDVTKPTKIKKTTICEKDIDDITKPTKTKKTTICEKDIDDITKPTKTKKTTICDVTKPDKKTTYRSIKGNIKTSEKELGCQLKEHVVEVDKEIDQIVYNNFDVSYKDITESIEKLFEYIKDNRVYTVSLTSIRKLRKKLLGKITLEEYTILLLDHINKLKVIFSDRKYSINKIRKIISTTLTPLDTRLVFYDGYVDINIEIDDVQKFGLALEILTEHKKQFIPYNKNDLFTNIKNYSISLFSIGDCIERCMNNRYGFNNIIYIDRPNSSSKDPYSFYSLEKVNDKRYWKMECRMEDFSIDFSDNVLPYCISLFRRIYKDVFSDNIYRPDYMNKSQIMEFDGEQLIQNIILMAQPMSLCRILHGIIIEKSTFTPTESDKFNLCGDDKLQQKRFISTIDSDDETCQVIKRLFDGISTIDAMTIITTR
jgi:hypothetical protein